MDETERSFALSKMKHQLDRMSLQVMAKLHQQYRVASLNLQKKKKRRGYKSDIQSSEECFFGLEHIIRELAQLYQLPDIITNDYAGAAADILLSGQPLKLLDGDSSYIPLRWFDAVYHQLECKTKNAKIFVIFVLGIQSSGKSTIESFRFDYEYDYEIRHLRANRVIFCCRDYVLREQVVAVALSSTRFLQNLVVLTTS